MVAMSVNLHSDRKDDRDIRDIFASGTNVPAGMSRSLGDMAGHFGPGHPIPPPT